MNRNRIIRASAGLVIGIGLGTAANNVALGIGLGIVFGVAMSRINGEGEDND